MYSYCPFCKQKYEIDQEHIGMSMECVSCAKNFVIQEFQTKNISMNVFPAQSNSKENKNVLQNDKISSLHDPHGA